MNRPYVGALLAFFAIACHPDSLPFQNPDLPPAERVADLLRRLTLEEKVAQLQNSAPAIPRLGIPAYDWWNEGLHGVARAGRATVFPQAIGLAATWDTALIRRVGNAIAVEGRAKHHAAARRGERGTYQGLTFWSPNINILRDPRWGRGMETYGEDPFLTGRLAVAFVRGIQGNDPHYLQAVATPKHFAVHSGPEPERHGLDALVTEHDLRDSYLPAFEAAVREGGAASVMCSYNRINGVPACANPGLLAGILRAEWGFQGYVVTDCDAVYNLIHFHHLAADDATASAQALHGGADLNCGNTFHALAEAVHAGLLRESEVDTALGRLFLARLRLGMFDPPERVSFARLPLDSVDSEAHRALALDAARESIVLLKNAGNLLPLDAAPRTIAVIGPTADDPDLLLGNYNGFPARTITPLEGISRAAPPGSHVLYARGSDLAPGMPSLVPIPDSALRRAAGDSSSGGSWRGEIRPPMSGEYALGVRALGEAKLWLGDSLMVDIHNAHEPETKSFSIRVAAGSTLPVRLTFQPLRAEAMVRLVWAPPEPDALRHAVAAAGQADLVLLCLGLSPRLEGEALPVTIPGFLGGDRNSLDLPAPQETLLRAVVATGKPVVLVLLSGSAVAVNWAAVRVPTILQAWYPGQASGTALADVVYGQANPSGRLPVTIYRSIRDLPPFSDYGMQGRTYRYFRGRPLFPFGHGLSYSRFAYGGLELAKSGRAGDSVTVTVRVRNTGARPGAEVVQLYLSRPEQVGPVRILAGFERVELAAGAVQRVRFTLSPRQLAVVDEEGGLIFPRGPVEVTVGGRQPGQQGMAAAATTGVVTGKIDIH